MTLLDRFGSTLRIAWYALHNIQIGAGTRLEQGTSLVRGFTAGRCGKISLGQKVELLRGAQLHAWGGRIVVADRVFLGPYAVVYGHGGVDIGEHTLVSMHCRILSSNHAIPPPGTLIRSQPDIPLPTKIGRDVWLGAGVTVLGGVTIGDGCIVGAGSVVTRDLPPNSIALGTPACIVRSRA